MPTLQAHTPSRPGGSGARAIGDDIELAISRRLLVARSSSVMAVGGLMMTIRVRGNPGRQFDTKLAPISGVGILRTDAWRRATGRSSHRTVDLRGMKILCEGSVWCRP